MSNSEQASAKRARKGSKSADKIREETSRKKCTRTMTTSCFLLDEINGKGVSKIIEAAGMCDCMRCCLREVKSEELMRWERDT